MEERVLLRADEVARTIHRLAHEILEKSGGAKDLALLGIRTRGVHLVERLAAKIEALTGAYPATGSIDVSPYRDDKERVREPRTLSMIEPAVSVDERTVILVDDVIYTGRTIRAALDFICHLGNPRRIFVATLVDRGERELPIKADIVGKNVSISASDRVNVRLEEVDGVDQVTVGSNYRRIDPGRQGA
jgi:pyrimidine operon attenuation protein / uracil phosphoribosyltransferase